MRILARGGLALLAAALVAAAWPEPRVPPAGFSQRRAPAHTRLEGRFLRIPSPARIREVHRILTSEPHVAGSERDRELAGFMRDRFRECGLDDVATLHASGQVGLISHNDNAVAGAAKDVRHRGAACSGRAAFLRSTGAANGCAESRAYASLRTAAKTFR